MAEAEAARPVEVPEAGPDRWAGADRVVQMRPHLWRWLEARLDGRQVLEMGPGLRPTAPADRGTFVETSAVARAALARRGGKAIPPEGTPSLPAETFGAVLAFEVLEHIPDDDEVVRQIARVLRPGGSVVVSTPIRRELWSPLDEACGHVRRYEPDELLSLLREAGLRVEGIIPTRGPLRHTEALQARALRRNPRAVNRMVQGFFFPAYALGQRLFGRLRWRSPDAPVPRRADGMLVWARKPGASAAEG
jgi:SAM-dependent methyltransferase